MSTALPSRRVVLSLFLLAGLVSSASASPFYALQQQLPALLHRGPGESKHSRNDDGRHGGVHPLPTDPHGPQYLYDGYPRASSMVGWISIACWIVVYTPQLWLCIVQQSGEGLSLVFLAIWLAGDATNLLGALWQGLLPTMIILAVYYSLCDIVLIAQVFYYRRKRALYPERFSAVPASPTPQASLSAPHETDPLLSAFSAHAPTDPEPSPRMRKMKDVISYVGGFVIVLGVGFIAWKLSRDVPEGRREEVWDTKAQIVGWASAFLYLGSRLPQITKNMETKCQGLSLLMFAFSVAGNGTYVASILLTSVSPQHLLINASWLVGSGGTIFLDFIVLGQFWYYSSARTAQAKIFADDEGLDDDEA